MTSDISLSDKDYEDIIGKPYDKNVPDFSRIKRGDRFSLKTKIGGKMQTVMVIAKDEPKKKGKATYYVEVFGYGVNKSVNVIKLIKHIDTRLV